MTEAQIETRMCAMVRKRGGLCLKWISPGTAGVPDRIVFAPGGGIYFVELKTAVGNLRKMQVWMHGLLAKCGVHVHVLHGWDEVKAFVGRVFDDTGEEVESDAERKTTERGA